MDLKFSIKNVITKSELDFLISYYLSRSDYVFTNGMKKYPVITDPLNTEFIEFITNIISNKLKFTDYEIIGDNYYEHSHSYFPHCDALQSNSWVNIVIPLELYNQKNVQKFLVFDQQYLLGTGTWMGSYNLAGNFLSNKKIQTIITETDGVVNSTAQDISDDYYDNFDQRFLSREYLFGISGSVYEWIPGDVIVFDSKFIHSTAKMNCDKKLGLSVRLGHKK
jgi:hypothetical protein